MCQFNIVMLVFESQNVQEECSWMVQPFKIKPLCCLETSGMDCLSSWTFQPFKIRLWCCLKVLGANYPVVQHHILEVLNSYDTLFTRFISGVFVVVLTSNRPSCFHEGCWVTELCNGVGSVICFHKFKLLALVLNSWWNLQNPGFKVQVLSFPCKLFKKKKSKAKERKTQQDCTKMAIIYLCICCIIWELNPASCDAA